MQPVTINNKQFTLTLWLIQWLLLLLTVMIIPVALIYDLKLLVIIPISITIIFINHKQIKRQHNYQFKMNSNGQLNLIFDLETDKQKSARLSIESCWQLPQILLLKMKHNKQTIYATIFRSVLGPQKYAHLLVGLTQVETNNEY